MIEDSVLEGKKIRLYSRKPKDGRLECEGIPIANNCTLSLQVHLDHLDASIWGFPNPGEGIALFCKRLMKGLFRWDYCGAILCSVFSGPETTSIHSENKAQRIDTNTISRHKKLTITEQELDQLKSCRSSLPFLPAGL